MNANSTEGQAGMDTGGAAFALDLFGTLPSGGNLVLSPASARMALGMALLGARGRTADDLARGLRVGSGPDDFHAAEAGRIARWSDASRPYALAVADAMFVAEGLRRVAGAEARLEEFYSAAMRALDFAKDPQAAAAEINRWVAESTRGLIPEIAPPGAVSRETRFVIANALYFKAEWRTKFTKDATHLAPFEVGPGDRPMVSTMGHTARHRVRVGPDAELLEMAYLGDDLAMTFLLPPKGTALADFESRLTSEGLRDWLSGLAEERVRLTLPRFSLNPGALSLRASLEAMGVRAPFDAGSADFGGFFEEPAVLDEVLHRARVDVDEQGTEAAAATAVFAYQSLDLTTPRVFAIDRPFLFLLRDLRDGTILFLGRVVDPR